MMALKIRITSCYSALALIYIDGTSFAGESMHFDDHLDLCRSCKWIFVTTVIVG